jgi:hypothetical protein
MTSEYDVIVLCPYLPERDRRALVAAARLSADPPTVIELHDSPLPRQVIGRGHYGASPLAERVLAALDAPRN